jgi:hypothetical protein
MVVYMSDPSYPAPISSEIQLDSVERQMAEDLSAKLAELINKEGAAGNVALGALAKLGMSLNAEKVIMESEGVRA